MKKRIHVVAGIIYNQNGHFMLARKKAGLPSGGFWEFPGGKKETGESPKSTLEREIREEFGMEIYNTRHSFSYDFESHDLMLHFEVCEADCANEPSFLADHDEIAWVKPGKDLPQPLAEADYPIMEFLKEKSGSA